MTNHKATADHNICGLRSMSSSAASESISAVRRRSEGGYTLVALLAMMTVVALFAMAAAPSVQQQALRDREQEAIYRGEQVAEAIKQWGPVAQTEYSGASEPQCAGPVSPP